MSDRVLVIGGTRGTGFLIAKLLQQHGYRVRAIAREEAEAKRKLGAEVEVVTGDITKPETLRVAVRDVDHIIFTAGVTKCPAGQQLSMATDYDGIKNTLAAGKQAGFRGRFLYMTSIGVAQSSLCATLLNLVKRNTLLWRRRAENEIRRSGLPYTIIRAGFLTNTRRGTRTIEVSQRQYPLAFKYRIARADVAEVFVQALQHASTLRTTFEVVWGKGKGRERWDVLFGDLKPDSCIERQPRIRQAP
jgi:uncharacterized protein YbjT (DUF2867 family)